MSPIPRAPEQETYSGAKVIQSGVKNRTLNPVWDFDCEFFAHSGSQLITFTVNDADMVGGHLVLLKKYLPSSTPNRESVVLRFS